MPSVTNPSGASQRAAHRSGHEAPDKDTREAGSGTPRPSVRKSTTTKKGIGVHHVEKHTWELWHHGDVRDGDMIKASAHQQWWTSHLWCVVSPYFLRTHSFSLKHIEQNPKIQVSFLHKFNTCSTAIVNHKFPPWNGAYHSLWLNSRNCSASCAVRKDCAAGATCRIGSLGGARGNGSFGLTNMMWLEMLTPYKHDDQHYDFHGFYMKFMNTIKMRPIIWPSPVTEHHVASTILIQCTYTNHYKLTLDLWTNPNDPNIYPNDPNFNNPNQYST